MPQADALLHSYLPRIPSAEHCRFVQTILEHAEELNWVTDTCLIYQILVSCFSGQFCFPPAWPKMLSLWPEGSVGFYTVCCSLQFFLGTLCSFPWHVSINTDTDTTLLTKTAVVDIAVVAAQFQWPLFPGVSGLYQQVQTTADTHVLCKQLATCSKRCLQHREGKTPRKVRHQSCLYFHMSITFSHVHYIVTCLVSAQVTVLTGTQAAWQCQERCFQCNASLPQQLPVFYCFLFALTARQASRAPYDSAPKLTMELVNNLPLT